MPLILEDGHLAAEISGNCTSWLGLAVDDCSGQRNQSGSRGKSIPTTGPGNHCPDGSKAYHVLSPRSIHRHSQRSGRTRRVRRSSSEVVNKPKTANHRPAQPQPDKPLPTPQNPQTPIDKSPSTVTENQYTNPPPLIIPKDWQNLAADTPHIHDIDRVFAKFLSWHQAHQTRLPTHKWRGQWIGSLRIEQRTDTNLSAEQLRECAAAMRIPKCHTMTRTALMAALTRQTRPRTLPPQPVSALHLTLSGQTLPPLHDEVRLS